MRTPRGASLAALLLSGCHLLLPLGSQPGGTDTSGADHPALADLSLIERPRTDTAHSDRPRSDGRQDTGRAPLDRTICPDGPAPTVTATAVPLTLGLTNAQSTFSASCTGAASLDVLSLFSLAGCPMPPTLDQVASAVLAQLQSSVGAGAPISLSDLPNQSPFSGCGSGAAKSLLDAIDQELKETGPRAWYGQAGIPPSCAGCTSFQVLVLLHYTESARVVVLQGAYSY